MTPADIIYRRRSSNRTGRGGWRHAGLTTAGPDETWMVNRPRVHEVLARMPDEEPARSVHRNWRAADVESLVTGKYNGVWSIALDGPGIHIGGEFTKVSGVPQTHYAKLT